MINNNYNTYFKNVFIYIKTQLKNNKIIFNDDILKTNIIKHINILYSQFKPNIKFYINENNDLVVKNNRDLSECDLYLLLAIINLTKVKTLKEYNIFIKLEIDEILKHIDIAYLDKIKEIKNDYLG